MGGGEELISPGAQAAEQRRRRARRVGRPRPELSSRGDVISREAVRRSETEQLLRESDEALSRLELSAAELRAGSERLRAPVPDPES